MYLGYQNNKIKFYTSQPLDIAFYNLDGIEETNEEYVLDGDEYVLKNAEWEQEQADRREAEFKKEFFETSLGWIRRSVSMKDGSKKDFLGELLMPIKAGLELGQQVIIITYSEPDFSEDVTDWEIYQDKKAATPQFISDCLNQIVIDFNGIEE